MSSIATIFLLIIASSLTQVNSQRGVDVGWFTEVISVDTAKCFVENDINFAIIEVGRSGGILNINASQTLLNLKEAGMQRYDIYIYPHVGGNAIGQVYAVFEYLNSWNITDYSMVWFDIEENKSDPWNKSCLVNILFLKLLISATETFVKPEQIGIYTADWIWDPYFCNTT